MRCVEDLQEIQSLAIKMLVSVVQFCEEKKISYYLAYGTLLGAVRHKGFIPWDDDIDLWMKREDFTRFCKEFDLAEKGLYLNFTNTVSNYNRAHAQVCMSNTKLVAQDRSNHYREGYFIDIFPIDGTPDNKLLRGMRLTRLQILKNIVSLVSYNIKPRTLPQRILRCVSALLQWVDTGKVMKKYERVASKSAVADSKYVQILAPGKHKGRNMLLDAQLFHHTKKQMFEGTDAEIPAGYDAILKQIYGDYMQLPPVEQRVPHHDFSLYMEE